MPGSSDVSLPRRGASVPRPLVLVRYPAVFAAVLGAALILAVSASAAPVFESSVAADSIDAGLRAEGGAALSIQARGTLAADVVAFRQRELDRSLAAVPRAGPPLATLWLQSAGISMVTSDGERGDPAPIQLLSRTGFLDHITIVEGASGSSPGIWIAESTAGATGIGVGDDVELVTGSNTARTTVAGVYRDLFVGEEDPFWAPLSGGIYPSSVGDVPAPPALAERDVFLGLTTELEVFGLYGWDIGIVDPDGERLTFADASRSAAAVQRLADETSRPDRPIGAALQAPSVRAPLVDVVEEARTTVGSIAGPVGTLSLAGQIAALVAVTGAAVYTARRRRTEVRLMHALGLPWVRFGVRSGIEGILPVALGAAVGWAGTVAGLRSWGPSPAIDGSAVVDAGVATAAAAGVSLVLLALASVAAARSEVSEAAGGRVSRFTMRAAWELPVLLLAGAALYEITSRGTGPVIGPNGIVRIDRFLLLFPILFIAGAAGLIVRGVAAGLTRIGAGATAAPIPVYLAVRRLGASSRIVLLLTTASCLAIGILIYGAAMANSIGVATVDKAHLGIGSDASATAPRLLSFPPARGLSATNVIEVSARTTAGDELVTVVGIEPDRFEAAAFWDPRFADRPLAELLRSLSEEETELRAIVANGDVAPGAKLILGGFEIPVAVVEEATAFPGQGPGTTVIVSTPLLQERLASHGISLGSIGFEYRAWVRGPSSRGATYLKSLGLSSQSIRTSAGLASAPGFRAVSSTFGFMQMLGIVSALVALVGMVLYVQARQGARHVSYALSERMGLSFGEHLLAVFIEMTAIMLTALVVGGALAVVAGAILAPWIDPLPALPPAPSLHAPYEQFLWALAATLTASGAASWLISRRAARANVAEVLRFAG